MARPKGKKKKLSAKIKRFISEYLIDQNGTQAAIRAGYSPHTSQPQSSRLLLNVMVRAEIERRLELIFQHNGIKARNVIQELTHIGMCDPAEITNEDGSIRSLRNMPERVRRAIASIKRGPRGEIEIRFWDKNASLTNLARHFKLLTDKIEIHGKVSLAMRVEQARKRVSL